MHNNYCNICSDVDSRDAYKHVCNGRCRVHAHSHVILDVRICCVCAVHWFPHTPPADTFLTLSPFLLSTMVKFNFPLTTPTPPIQPRCSLPHIQTYIWTPTQMDEIDETDKKYLKYNRRNSLTMIWPSQLQIIPVFALIALNERTKPLRNRWNGSQIKTLRFSYVLCLFF